MKNKDRIREEIIEMIESKAGLTFKISFKIHELKNEFEKTSDFLKYCKDEIGIGKASVYNYLKLYSTFGNNPSFASVAVRVLVELAKFKWLDDIIDEAEALALSGKLDTKAAIALIEGQEEKLGIKKDSKETVKTSVEASVSSESDEQEINSSNEDELPWASTETATKYDDTTIEGVTVPAKQEDNTTKDLVKQIELLAKQLEDANATIIKLQSKSERDVKIASVPSLPQFSSACYYARLGLSQSESAEKARVKKAFRELVKVGYGEGHESYSKIKEAVDFLLA